MEQATGVLRGSTHDDVVLESIQFNEEIRGIMAPAPAPENASSFTALLELPPTQAVELLHSPDCPAADREPPCHVSTNQKPYLLCSYGGNLTFPSNAALIERAAKFSVFAGENSPPEDAARLAPVAVSGVVKNEPQETDSNPSSTQGCVSDPAVDTKNQKTAKRKEREKKARREKINARMKLLQELVPGCNKISGTALVLDEIINHVQSLQRQVEFLSMKLAAVNPRIDFSLDSLLATDGSSVMDSNLTSMASPVMWPENLANGNRQHFQQHWQFDAFHQPLWGREEANHNFMTPEHSLLSYDSSANSASLQSNQLKMEL
ncbi:hypothetical protein Ahy_A06g026719 [Arachis hypogaea]|uniref:BHLH domain-containing protein n=1 Tax=Arachis hypogaea TaxID=3818 RepID=A0A445CLF4_ARAHY|nr:hypothetical protein Ahy_A06g026719 [Arachis hypogaea]